MVNSSYFEVVGRDPSKVYCNMINTKFGLYANRLSANSVKRTLTLNRPLFRRPISLKSGIDKLKMKSSPPGGVIGDVNEPYMPPETDMYHGSYHWTYERLNTAALIPLCTYAIASTVAGGDIHPLIDATLAASALFHLQFEFSSCIIDYIPKRKFGVWNNLTLYLLYGGSALGLYGIYELETKSNGIVNLVSKLWTDDESNLYIFGRN